MGYLELGIIFIGAVGAALLLGTGAAVLRYRRTGEFPGQPEGATDADTTEALRGARLKMAFGAVITALGGIVLVAVLD